MPPVAINRRPIGLLLHEMPLPHPIPCAFPAGAMAGDFYETDGGAAGAFHCVAFAARAARAWARTSGGA